MKLLKLSWQTLDLELLVQFGLLQRRELGLPIQALVIMYSGIRVAGATLVSEYVSVCSVSRRAEAHFVMGEVRFQRTFGTVRLMSKLMIVPSFFLKF